MLKDKEYRSVIITHLEYIKEKVDVNHKHLLKLNNRVSKNERSITKIFTFGTTLSALFTLILTYLGIRR